MNGRERTAWQIARLARWLPARLRGRFGDEIEEVLAERLTEAALRGWLPLLGAVLLELAHLPGIYLRERFSRRDAFTRGVDMAGRMDALLSEQHEPVSWGWSMVGLAPFLLIGLIGLVFWGLGRSAAPAALSESPWFIPVISHFYLALVAGLSAVLVAAWVKGFPVWSYTTGFLYFFFSLYLTQVSMPGLTLFGYEFGSSLLGARALIPLAVVIVVSLLLTRNDLDRPIKAGIHGLENDLSRLSFGLFGLSPFFLFMIFDEVHNEELFVHGLNLLLAACALVYLRTRRAAVGMGALLAGLVVTWTASAVYLGIYWNGRQENWMPAPGDGFRNFFGTLVCAVPVILFTLGPWLIHRYNHRPRPSDKG